MTNTRVISLVAILGLILLTAYRLIKTVQASEKFHTAWVAGLLILVISVATDLNDGLGAAVALAVLIGVMVNSKVNVVGLITAKGASSAPSTGGGGGGGTTKTCPSGQVLINGQCVPLIPAQKPSVGEIPLPGPVF